MNLITYVDNLVEIFMDIKIFYSKQIKKYQKLEKNRKVIKSMMISNLY